jgi:hypothetical protein
MLPSKNTSLHLEGFPRSGNTFAWNLLYNTICVNGKLNICHHLHSVGSIKMSLNKNVRVFILIRNPLDTIASCYLKYYATRNLGNPNYVNIPLLEHVAKQYINFYSYCLQKSSRIRIIFFKDLVSNPLKFVLFVQSMLKLDSLTFNKNDIHLIINKFSDKESRKNPLGSSMPSDFRNQEKEKISQGLVSIPIYSQSKSLFEELVKLKTEL